jgi:hypothetical protein
MAAAHGRLDQPTHDSDDNRREVRRALRSFSSRVVPKSLTRSAFPSLALPILSGAPPGPGSQVAQNRPSRLVETT